MDRVTADDFRVRRAHASERTLASYVIGALTDEDAEALEAHVFECDVCSDALAREARLERALELVAEDLPPEPVAICIPVVRSLGATAVTARAGRRSVESVGATIAPSARWGGVLGAVAIAASVLLWLGPGHRAASETAARESSHAHGGSALDLDASHGASALSGEGQADAEASVVYAHDLDGG